MAEKKKRLVLTVALAASSLVGLAAGRNLPPNVDVKGANQQASNAVQQDTKTAQQVVLSSSQVLDTAGSALGHTSHSSHASHASHASHRSHQSGV